MSSTPPYRPARPLRDCEPQDRSKEQSCHPDMRREHYRALRPPPRLWLGGPHPADETSLVAMHNRLREVLDMIETEPEASGAAKLGR